MKLAIIARLSVVAGLLAGGTLAGVGAPAQAAGGWVQSNKVCKQQTAGTVCLEERRSTTSGERHARMVLTPRSGHWIRPDTWAVYGWDFGSERGACDLEGCAKVTRPMTGAWVKSGRVITGLGYSTPHGRFAVAMGETPSKTIRTSGWKDVDPGRVAVQASVKLRNGTTYYSGTLRLQSVDGVPIQPRTVTIQLLRNGTVAASARRAWTSRVESTSWSGTATRAVSMPSRGYDAIRVTGTHVTPSGATGSVSTTYTHAH